jgi:putative flippase GtrA
MIAGLLDRYGRLIRFVLVGGGVTLIYTLLTAGLIMGPLAGHRVWASAAASVVTIPISFLVHRRITYADTPRHTGQSTRFTLIALANLLVNTGNMTLSAELHWPFWTALMAGWVIVPMVNFALNTLWVFRAARFLGLATGEPRDAA